MWLKRQRTAEDARQLVCLVDLALVALPPSPAVCYPSSLATMSDLGVVAENSWVPPISPKFMLADSHSQPKPNGRKERFGT